MPKPCFCRSHLHVYFQQNCLFLGGWQQERWERHARQGRIHRLNCVTVMCSDGGHSQGAGEMCPHHLFTYPE